jgi:exodeoxyribonuclease-3
VRIATWNINGLKARQDFLLLWLRERQPDIVGLQELKATDDAFPHDALAEIGYHAVTHGQKSWNGVAVLSRTPATRVAQVGLPGQEEMGSRLLTVEVAGIEFTTIYCPNGKTVTHEDFPRKLAWLDELIVHLGERPASDKPAVVCGDFNLVPSALDSWNEAGMVGSIFHTDAERSRYQRLLAGGWHDLFRERWPDDPGFTWWDYRAGAFHKKMGLRIDFLLATRELAAATSEVHSERDWRKKKEGLTPSDHAPVYADLDWAPAT